MDIFLYKARANVLVNAKLDITRMVKAVENAMKAASRAQDLEKLNARAVSQILLNLGANAYRLVPVETIFQHQIPVKVSKLC